MLKRLIKLAISIVVYFSDRLTLSIQKLSGFLPKGTCVVLYYHAIKEAERSRFASQLDIILSAGEPICAVSPKRLSDGCRYFAITFDDAP